MSVATKKEAFPGSELEKQKELIKRTICKGASDDELQLFIKICERTQLDPFAKQIFGIMRMSKGVNTMTTQIAIDGLRLIADRTGKYSPGKEPVFSYDKDDNLISATSFIKKCTADGTWHEVGATALLTEYLPAYPSNFWKEKKHLMLAKCAEALALRKAFPADMSGLYIQEELEAEVAEVEVIEEESELMREMLEKVGHLQKSKDDISEYLIHIGNKWKMTKIEAAKRGLGNFDAFVKNFIEFVADRHKASPPSLNEILDESGAP